MKWMIRLLSSLSLLRRGLSFSQRFENTTAANQVNGHRQRNPLEDYFDAHVEGPGLWKWRHYFEIYHRHFQKFIGREVHVLEIGIYSGGSLSMWHHYFGGHAHVYGVDIEEACRTYETEHTTIFIGDQGDREFWRRVRSEAPLIDVVIDDGAHVPEKQIVALEELLPHLQPGGVYLCEDIHGGFNQFASYISGLWHFLNEYQAEVGPEMAITPLPFQRFIRSIHLYPFVVAIEKGDLPVNRFVAPRKGTEWQPFTPFAKARPA
jgi:hypothetical protein